jgi:DNA-binding NtrC family response regulator
MQALKRQITDVAGSEATLLLVGESGTGKELVARAVHAKSRRHEAPFVAVNCAAIPESLLESELFGHEKGAFTGAVQSRRGLFAEASGGTLFLDEIADMPLPLQAKVLRALQERQVRPVGGRAEIAIDVRFISATNRDLACLVQLNRFREDLYYRLAVIPIHLPSLRERPDDVALLARHFAVRTAQRGGKAIDGISDEAVQWLQRQRWPGNVRQLENVIERAVTLARGPTVELDDVQPHFAGPPGTSDGGVRPTLAEIEYDYMQRVLEETRGDKRAAASILGVSLRTLQRKTPAHQSSG